jgi:hypothetical protein
MLIYSLLRQDHRNGLRRFDTAGCQVPCRGIIDSSMCIRMKREELGYGWVCIQFPLFHLGRWRNCPTPPRYMSLLSFVLWLCYCGDNCVISEKGETRKGSQSAGRIGAETFSLSKEATSSLRGYTGRYLPYNGLLYSWK